MNFEDDKSIVGESIKLHYSLEAEQSVLGAILIDSSCFSRVVEIIVNPSYFFISNHKLIYSVMLDMFTIGEPIDYITVLDKLKLTDNSDSQGVKSYLLQLAQRVPSGSNVEYYAQIVRDKYSVRILTVVAREIIDDLKLLKKVPREK